MPGFCIVAAEGGGGTRAGAVELRAREEGATERQLDGVAHRAPEDERGGHDERIVRLSVGRPARVALDGPSRCRER